MDIHFEGIYLVGTIHHVPIDTLFDLSTLAFNVDRVFLVCR